MIPRPGSSSRADPPGAGGPPGGAGQGNAGQGNAGRGNEPPDDAGGRALAPDDADLVRAAVLAVPGVAGLHAGRFGEIATYLPGRRVRGIRSDDTGTDVHVVLREGADLRATAQAIHRAAAAVTGGPIRVHIDDLVPDLKEH